MTSSVRLFEQNNKEDAVDGDDDDDNESDSVDNETVQKSTNVNIKPIRIEPQHIVLNNEEKNLISIDMPHDGYLGNSNIVINNSNDVSIGHNTTINGDVNIYGHVTDGGSLLLSPPSASLQQQTLHPAQQLPSLSSTSPLPPQSNDATNHFGIICPKIAFNVSIVVAEYNDTAANCCTTNNQSETAAAITACHLNKSINLILLFLLCLVIAFVVIAIILLIKNNKIQAITLPTDTERSTFTTPSNRQSHPYIINRTIWGSLVPRKEEQTTELVSLVLLSQIKSETCYDVSGCFELMQKLQSYDIGTCELSNIRYNFVIGGDGNIYEGRGWGIQNDVSKNTLSIASMGHFDGAGPNGKMLSATNYLIEQGRSNGYLSLNATKWGILIVIVGVLGIYLLIHYAFRSSSSASFVGEEKQNGPPIEEIVSRNVWGAELPKKPLQKMPKAELVVIKQTDGETCFDFNTCSKRVHQIQINQMHTGNLPDIEYNFLIGGDGRIYHGRGWRIKPDHIAYCNRTIDVAFIGNFTEQYPSNSMLEALDNLILSGYENGIKYSKYFVVCDKQLLLLKKQGGTSGKLCESINDDENIHYYISHEVTCEADKINYVKVF